MDKMKVMY